MPFLINFVNNLLQLHNICYESSFIILGNIVVMYIKSDINNSISNNAISGIHFGKLNTKFLTKLGTDTFERKYSQETIKNMVREYQKCSYINDYLRKNVPLSESAQKQYDVLMYAINTAKPLDKELVTYRGLIINPKKNLDINTILNNNKGFTSVTEDKSLASSFSLSKYGEIVKITFPKDFKLLKAPYEYIAPPNTKFTDAVYNQQEKLWEVSAVL